MSVPKTPSQELGGRRALVTGASRGIGFAAAAALVQAGASVTLLARDKKKLAAAMTQLRQEGGEVAMISLDLADTARVRDYIESNPPFRILVNNAGTTMPTPFTEVSEEEYDNLFTLNVRAAFFATQAVARSLIAHKQAGSVINISSQMGLVGGVRRTVYCATKHAMEGFTKAMALDLAAHSIRVNTICPTFIDTELVRPHLADKSFKEYVLGKIALGRVGKAEEIMAAVVYLASDASSLMTGSALVLDGGWTAA